MSDGAVVRLPERLTDGEDLVVRCWTLDDVPALAAAIDESLEHLRPWMAWIAHEPLSDADRRGFVEAATREWESGGDATYGIFVDGAVAGGTGLHRRGDPDTLEIGYWLHPDHVGAGLMTRVAAVLTSAALDVEGIDAVEIHHDVANERSAAVPRRLGYRRLDDMDHQDHAVWRIERAQWEQQSR